MPGKIYLRKHILRMDPRLNPDMLFAFGDNMLRRGLGGQAKEMRGEPNAVGIPTKWSPLTTNEAYFSNFDFQNARVRGAINSAFERLTNHLNQDKNLVFPLDGIGTGLSQLEYRAPEILRYIELNIRRLYQITESPTPVGAEANNPSDPIFRN